MPRLNTHFGCRAAISGQVTDTKELRLINGGRNGRVAGRCDWSAEVGTGAFMNYIISVTSLCCSSNFKAVMMNP